LVLTLEAAWLRPLLLAEEDECREETLEFRLGGEYGLKMGEDDCGEGVVMMVSSMDCLPSG